MKGRMAWLARRGRRVVRNCRRWGSPRSLFFAAVCANTAIFLCVSHAFGGAPPRAPGFSLSAHYTTALAAVAVAWLAVPAYLLVRRLTRRRPAPPPPPARAATVAERLFAIVDTARARELGIDERGRLELLMLQELRAHAAADHATATSTLASLADAISEAPWVILRPEPSLSSLPV
jgi:membrane protein implicated in regulation of membrane protease activity